MRPSASSILRMSLRTRSRVRSSRLNSLPVGRSDPGSWQPRPSYARRCGPLRAWGPASSSCRILRKWSSCSLLMYCSPRWRCTAEHCVDRPAGFSPATWGGRERSWGESGPHAHLAGRSERQRNRCWRWVTQEAAAWVPWGRGGGQAFQMLFFFRCFLKDDFITTLRLGLRGGSRRAGTGFFATGGPALLPPLVAGFDCGRVS